MELMRLGRSCDVWMEALARDGHTLGFMEVMVAKSDPGEASGLVPVS